MFANNLMKPVNELFTVAPNDTVKRALDTINDSHLLSIPVAGNKKFYGCISKEMVYAFYFQKAVDKKVLLEDFKVEDIMRKDLPCISPLDGVEKAAEYLETKNIPFVAVVDTYGEFKGIVTHNAIFHEFTELFGLNKGKRLAVVAHDIPGQISRLSRIITENHGDIISFVVVDPKSAIDVKEIVVRLVSDNFNVIVKKVIDAGFQVQD